MKYIKLIKKHNLSYGLKNFFIKLIIRLLERFKKEKMRNKIINTFYKIEEMYLA